MDMRVVKATKYRKIFVGSHKCGLDAILSKNGGIARWKCCWEFTENISGLLLDKKQGAPFGAPCEKMQCQRRAMAGFSRSSHARNSSKF